MQNKNLVKICSAHFGKCAKIDVVITLHKPKLSEINYKVMDGKICGFQYNLETKHYQYEIEVKSC